MLIPRGYVKNRFDVYGRDSSIFSRGVADVDRIFAVYTILFVEERFESKGLDVYCLKYTESHTRLGMNRYVIWKTRIAAVLVARRCLYLFARNPFYAIKARFGTVRHCGQQKVRVRRAKKVIYLVQRFLSNFNFVYILCRDSWRIG